MTIKAIREDLSALTEIRGKGWFYKDYRVQADPNTHRFVVNYLSRLDRIHKILDLGSGNGALPAQILDAGFHVSSTSWNGKCKVGKSIYEINLDNGFTLEDAGGKQFDVITAIDIIEHVENPWAFLRSCENAIKDNGLILVSTPNLECARARLDWLIRGYSSDFSPHQIEYNRHISPIWRPGFLAMTAQAGLIVTESFPFGYYRKHSAFKRFVFQTFEKLLPDHAVGTTILYVLKKSGKRLDLDADNIY